MSTYPIKTTLPSIPWWKSPAKLVRSSWFLLFGDITILFFSQMIVAKYRSGASPGLSSLTGYEPLLITLFVGAYHLAGLYGLAKKTGAQLLIEMGAAGFMVAAVGGLSDYLLPGAGFGRRFLWPELFLVLGLGFLLRLSAAGLASNAASLRKVLVVADPADAAELHQALAARPGFTLAGYLSTDDSASVPVPWLGTPDHLAMVVAQLRPAEIVFGTRGDNLGEEIRRSLLRHRFAGISVSDLASFYQRVSGTTPLSCVDDQWLLWANGFELVGNSRVQRLKRLIDFLLASVGMIVSTPIMLLVAAAIKLDSRGPVFYRQQRVGFREKPFELLKFRSMTADSMHDGQARWTDIQDRRVTRVGRFIRRTHLDELPQFWNVLRGEMSFVGPRPEQVPITWKLRQLTPYYSFRHSVRPGITGWAQIHNGYCGSDEDSLKKLEYDLYYVQHMSLPMDISIVFHTIFVVLTAQGSR